MEWRHTLEILTKDIQDIEKLVGNLQNSADSPSIDLDLALSKLRNVYEVLTMIKEDQMAEKRSVHVSGRTRAADEQKTTIPEHEAGHSPEKPAGQETGASAESSRSTEGAHPSASATTPEKEQPAEAGSPVPAKEQPAEAGSPKSVSRETMEEPAKEADSQQPGPGSAHEGATQAAQHQDGGKAILAEKFSATSSINDNLAGKRPAGAEAKLAGKPIDNIHRNIGINDRFLIIRELFKGDADSFRTLINELDEAGDLHRATELLHQRFPDTPDHEGLDILEGLIKRRFTRV